jgi:hypothetical protein
MFDAKIPPRLMGTHPMRDAKGPAAESTASTLPHEGKEWDEQLEEKAV